VRDRLATVEVDGREHLLAPETADLLAACRAEAGGPFLLPGFDEFVLGYADRSCAVPPEFADRIVPGGNGVFRPTVVHGGRVLGTWACRVAARSGRSPRRRSPRSPTRSPPRSRRPPPRCPERRRPYAGSVGSARSTTNTGMSRSVFCWYSV
jgi:hypothetical protein